MRRRGVLVVLLILIVMGGGYALVGSSIMELEIVEVSGNERVSKEQVASATELSAGVHLLSISTGVVERRVESLPWVIHARAERIIPSKLRVTVEERVTIAEVTIDGIPYLVDAHGVILQEGTGLELKITGLPVPAAVPGDQLDRREFREALAVIDSLDEEVRLRVNEVQAASIDRLTLLLDDETRIVFGAAEHLQQKNYSLAAVIASAEREGYAIASIDLRVPGRPAVRPR